MFAVFVTIGFLAFIVGQINSGISEERLNEQRNSILFMSAGNYSEAESESHRELFYYNWRADEIVHVLQSPEEGVEDSALQKVIDGGFYFLSGGIYHIPSQTNGKQVQILTYDDADTYIREYEAQHKGTYSEIHTFEEREDIWYGAGLPDVEAYKNGFLYNRCGGLYYFIQQGETFEVNSFENLPLLTGYFLAGKNKNMVLALVRNEDDIYASDAHRKKAEVYLYDINAHKSENIFETIASNQEFCLNADGTRLAYLDSSQGEYPVLKIYDIEKREIVKTTDPIKKLSDKQFRGTGLQEVEFLTLLDSGEVLARRRDVTIGTSLASGSENTLVLISENGQTKAPKALQKYRITDVVTEYDAAWQQG